MAPGGERWQTLGHGAPGNLSVLNDQKGGLAVAERKMLAVEVYANKAGNIVLRQEDPLQSEEYYIEIHPSQADTVIAWLREVRDEIATMVLENAPD